MQPYPLRKLQYDFLKMRGGVKGRLEFFRKFIRFGSRTLPEDKDADKDIDQNEAFD